MKDWAKIFKERMDEMEIGNLENATAMSMPTVQVNLAGSGNEFDPHVPTEEEFALNDKRNIPLTEMVGMSTGAVEAAPASVGNSEGPGYGKKKKRKNPPNEPSMTWGNNMDGKVRESILRKIIREELRGATGKGPEKLEGPDDWKTKKPVPAKIHPETVKTDAMKKAIMGILNELDEPLGNTGMGETNTNALQQIAYDLAKINPGGFPNVERLARDILSHEKVTMNRVVDDAMRELEEFVITHMDDPLNRENKRKAGILLQAIQSRLSDGGLSNLGENMIHLVVLQLNEDMGVRQIMASKKKLMDLLAGTEDDIEQRKIMRDIKAYDRFLKSYQKKANSRPEMEKKLRDLEMQARTEVNPRRQKEVGRVINILRKKLETVSAELDRPKWELEKNNFGPEKHKFDYKELQRRVGGENTNYDENGIKKNPTEQEKALLRRAGVIAEAVIRRLNL